MFTSAVEKYIRTANTYRILRFHGENGPFEDSLFCHKFECGRRHFEKQLCNLVGNTTSQKSTQMVDQNARSKNGFCLICCLAAGAWVRIIRVRVQPWYESSTLLVSGQVTKQQSSFRRIRRKVTLLSRMSRRGFSWRKKINRFRKHFQFSSKNLKRYWKFFKHNENSGGLFKVFPYTVFVQVIFSRFSSVLFSIYLFPQLFKTLL